MKTAGRAIVAVEQSPRAADYKTFTLSGDMVLVFGNEVDGVSEEMVNLADAAIAIPMRGKKESLNVSVAVGIALYRLLDRYR